MKDNYEDFLRDETKTRHPGGIENGIPFEYWDIGMVRNAKDENKKRLKVFLKPAPHVVMDQNVPMRGWYKNKTEPKGVRVRPCYTEALLTQPYGGSCPVKCAFCYVNNGIRGYRGQGVTVVDPKYPEKIAKQLDKMAFGWNAYISSFTEAFQSLEAIYHNTERLSEVITSRGLPLFYLTRQVPPAWAIDYLKKSQYSYMQFSIITSNRKAYKKLSPGAAPLDDILDCIRTRLKPAGIYVSIQVNPIVPGVITLPEILALIEELSEAGANHCIFKFVEIVAPASGALIEKMAKLFGNEKALEFSAVFHEMNGGVRTVNQETRLEWLDAISAKIKSVGMTMGLCYEYDKYTGQSLGLKYCSADQCHGFKVPIHIKGDDGIFRPLEEYGMKSCPPSGCLYCKEQSNGEAPACGVKLLQRATALAPSDYNTNYWSE